MKLSNPAFPLLCGYGLFLAGLAQPLGAEDIIYQTDFSDFNAGQDQLAGREGWEGSHVGQGLHGIDEDIYVGQDHSAYLGGTPTDNQTDLVRVYHSFHEAVPQQAEIKRLQFQVLFGIVESLIGGYDTFSFVFYSETNEFLAALHFDTTEFDYGIWTDDGEEATYTGEVFLTDYLHLLTVEIDPQNNQWQADLDGIPIFETIAFTSQSANSPAPVGKIAAEWRISDPSDPGDNWLLFDDWRVTGTLETPGPPVPDLTTIQKLADGSIELRWNAVPQGQYRVYTSEDGLDWTPIDPLILTTDDSPQAFYTASPPSAISRRLYRVQPTGFQP